MDDFQDKVVSSLDKIIDLLGEMSEKLGDQIDIQSQDKNPWPYKLVAEMNSCQDCDGNGMVYGHDFIIDENLENVPPSLHSMFVFFMNRNHNMNRLRWEDYLESLPEGEHKDRVSDFVSTLNVQ